MQRKLPAIPVKWTTVITAVFGQDSELASEEKDMMTDAVVIDDGGYSAVRAAVAEKRKLASSANTIRPI